MSSSYSTQHTDIINPDDKRDERKYCTLCDEYFDSLTQLLVHVQTSDVHPRCKPCDRGFLNGNARNQHYAKSSNHIYCYPCNKHFKSDAALDVHLKYSIRHSDDSDDEYEADDRPNGWEDELAEKLEREERTKQVEQEVLVKPEEEEKLSNVQRTEAMLRFRARQARGVPSESRSYCCPVCLSHSKTIASTRCGHLFCVPCIFKAIEQKGECPSCRTKNAKIHIRKLDMGMY